MPNTSVDAISMFNLSAKREDPGNLRRHKQLHGGLNVDFQTLNDPAYPKIALTDTLVLLARVLSNVK
jgi:hypothetical protein